MQARKLIDEAIDGPSFEEVMAKFMKLGTMERLTLRRAASKSLVDGGAEEVGSSDINHEIVRLYRQVGNFDDIPSEVGFSSIGEAVDHLGDREYQTFQAWKRATKIAYPTAEFYGDKDIGGASADVNGKKRQCAEWDGDKGTVFKK
jgi:hypothetical protein